MFCPQTPIASGGWRLRPQALSVTRLSCTNLLTTSSNFDILVNFLTWGFSLFPLANPGYVLNQPPTFWSFILYPTKKYLFSRPSSDVIACDLRFSPPPNSKSWLRLCIKPCAICIPDTGCRILVLHRRSRDFGLGGGLNRKSQAMTSSESFEKKYFFMGHRTLQRCKAAKYTLHCFQSA